ncbi:hypothetical protein KY289_026106 [Solanum tuberosum]|nr:hypothetical protein KY289_026106 [Solanum tuberosum]
MCSGSSTSALLIPFAFQLALNLVEEKDKKAKEFQDNTVAVNFTPQSKIGKMLVAKCRTLFEETEEIETRLMKEGIR